jgi:hypothetical protein
LNIYIYVGVEVMCYLNRGDACQLDATANNGEAQSKRKALDPTAGDPGICVKFVESILTYRLRFRSET